MKVIADLHVHGRYAAACSKELSIGNLEKYAGIKGVNLLGTGDCLHPQWLDEIRNNLEEDENGILWTKNKFPFVLQTEVSLIYTQGKGRRIHYILLVPNLGVLGQIIEELKKKGRVDYDGRPIFGFSSMEFVEKMVSISKDIEIIPAHAWTSWYGIFGSMSGFDSLEECFGEKTKYIHAIETGLSSNPKMNWRIKFLDNIAIVSFSDLHAYWPWRLGREATVFDFPELSYKNIIGSIRENRIAETIEFFPEEGKYHFDGHRNCNFSCSPSKSKELKGICPRCGGKLTIGVLNRVEALADREEGYVPNNATPYKSFVPLSELIAAVLGTTPYSKGVWGVYSKLIDRFKDEFNVLLNVSKDELAKVTDSKISDLIIKNREGQIKIIPGYDGVYGKLAIEETHKEEGLKRFLE